MYIRWLSLNEIESKQRDILEYSRELGDIEFKNI